MLPYSYNSNYQIVQTNEYACHEGNYSLSNMLRGFRAAERRPVKVPKR